ncbi:MAG: hypothetical protein ACM3JD_04555 [Rudaea sp.]
MKRFSLGLVALLALAAIATACGGSGPAPSQATPVPPTATPLPPTATPMPTVPSAAATLGPGVFTDALAKSKAATAYQLDMQMSGSGTFNPLNGMSTPEPGVTPTAAPSDQLVPLVAIKGEVNGKDSHILMQGMMATFVGVDANKGLELTIAGDKAYVHGPVPMLGATEDKWYEMPASEAANLAPGVEPGALFDQFTQTGLNPNDFAKSGTENLDNQSCDVYLGDKNATLKTFQDLNKGPASNGQLPNFEIDNADFRFWVCGDGYLNQVRLSIEGHQKDNANVKGTFLVLMHIFDLNGKITITPPANASPLPAPPAGLPLGTPTP